MDFVVAAYAVIWVIFFAYVFVLARRLSALEGDVARLKEKP